MVLLLLVAGSAAAVALALAASRRSEVGSFVAVVLIGVAWLIDVAMLAYSVSLGLH